MLLVLLLLMYQALNAQELELISAEGLNFFVMGWTETDSTIQAHIMGLHLLLLLDRFENFKVMVEGFGAVREVFRCIILC